MSSISRAPRTRSAPARRASSERSTRDRATAHGPQRALLKVLLPVYGAGLLFLLVALAYSSAAHVPFDVLSRDPVAQLDGSFHTGVLSGLTVLAWTCAAAFCLLAAAILPRWGPVRARRLLVVGGVLSSLLALDDLYMLHEAFGLLVPGLGPLLVAMLYVGGGSALILLAVGVRTTVPGVLWALLPSCALLGLSLAFDVLAGDLHVMEDGTKLLGAFGWAGAFAIVAVAAVRASSEGASDAGPERVG